MKQSARILGVIILLSTAGCFKYKNNLDVDTVVAIFNAIDSGDLASLKDLYAKNPKITEAKDPATQQTPLMRAAIKNRAEIAEFLLEKGEKIDVQDRYTRKTALHFAAEKNSADVARILLKHGANTKLRDLTNRTPKDSAQVTESADVIALFNEVDK